MSSAVHVVHLEDRSGERFRLVLRRYVREDWLAEEPDVAAREADALRILEDYHPYWDIAVEVGPADSYGDHPDPELDAWIARAVAGLG
jgi:hypothetical protein